MKYFPTGSANSRCKIWINIPNKKIKKQNLTHMKRTYLLLMTVFLLILQIGALHAQQTVGGITKPEAYSVLKVVGNYSTNMYGGLRLPQLTTTQRNTISDTLNVTKAEARGLTIYNLDTKCVEVWNDSKWVSLCAVDASSIVQVIRDSVTKWYQHNTILHDSIINTVRAKAYDVTSPKNTVALGGNTKASLNNLTVDIKAGDPNSIMTTDGSGNVRWQPATSSPGAVSAVYEYINNNPIIINKGYTASLIEKKTIILAKPSTLMITYSAVGLPAEINHPVQGSIDLYLDEYKRVSSYYSGCDSPDGTTGVLHNLGNYSTASKTFYDLPAGMHTIELKAKSWFNNTKFNIIPHNNQPIVYTGSDINDQNAMSSRLTIIVLNQ